VRAESSGARTLEDSEGSQRRDRAAVELYSCCRRIVLYRLVIARQVGTQPSFEERREVGRSRHGLGRTPGQWSAERFRMPWHLARVRRLRGAGQVTARVTGCGGRAQRRCGAQQRQSNRAACPHQHYPTGDGQRHGNRNCRVESATLSHSARADAMRMTFENGTLQCAGYRTFRRCWYCNCYRHQNALISRLYAYPNASPAQGDVH
jgi:hypothetical protein